MIGSWFVAVRCNYLEAEHRGVEACCHESDLTVAIRLSTAGPGISNTYVNRFADVMIPWT
jgi:hypothetical protein